MRHSISIAIAFVPSILLIAPATQAGDFNGDGYDDLAIGVPNKMVAGETMAGSVIVMYGSATGLRSTLAAGAPVAAQMFTESPAWWPGAAPQAESHFGDALASGDFNDDGYDDLAISADSRDFDEFIAAGQVYILFGGLLGLGPNGSTTLNAGDFPGQRPESLAHFGTELAAGDFDGDGADDLVIGSPYRTVGGAMNAGMVYCALGLPGRLFLDPALSTSLDTLFGAATAMIGDYFGSALAVGDFDSDGMDDLVVGAPGRSHLGVVDCGAVYESHGTAGGGLFAGAAIHVQSMFPGAGGMLQAGAGFGTALVCGDFDGNGSDDVAIGAPFFDSGGKIDCGAVYCTGGTAGVGLTYGWHPDQVFDQDRFALDTNRSYDNYGKALSAGEFGWVGEEAPSCADLVIGCPGKKIGANEQAGMLHVLPGDDGFGPALGEFAARRWHQNSAGVLEAAAAEDRFASVLSVGDFNGDGYDDLVIGVNLEDVGTLASGANAGSVQVIYSTTIAEPGGHGLTATGNQLWHQNSAGVPGSNAAGDHFGASLSR